METGLDLSNTRALMMAMKNSYISMPLALLRPGPPNNKQKAGEKFSNRCKAWRQPDGRP